MKKCIVLTALVVCTNFLFAQINGANSHAKELLEVMGSGKISSQMMTNMITAYKQNMPNVPVEFWDEFQKQINIEDLMELLVPIYVKYYSDDELVQLIAFYKSPLGKKFTEKLPLVNQESFNAGQEWGRKIGEKVMVELKGKGYLKDN
jgi:hypothetical protein